MLGMAGAAATAERGKQMGRATMKIEPCRYVTKRPKRKEKTQKQELTKKKTEKQTTNKRKETTLKEPTH